MNVGAFSQECGKIASPVGKKIYHKCSSSSFSSSTITQQPERWGRVCDVKGAAASKMAAVWSMSRRFIIRSYNPFVNSVRRGFSSCIDRELRWWFTWAEIRKKIFLERHKISFQCLTFLIQCWLTNIYYSFCCLMLLTLVLVFDIPTLGTLLIMLVVFDFQFSSVFFGPIEAVLCVCLMHGAMCQTTVYFHWRMFEVHHR